MRYWGQFLNPQIADDSTPLFRAAQVASAAPPYDTLHLKVFYPARPSGSDQEQNMGIVPADVDLAMFAPDAYGSGPTATAMPAILNVLEELQHEGVLAGLLDLQHIVIGGHSAGGRAAVESASTQFYPQVAGAFSYGFHTAAVTQLGYGPRTILPLPDNLPLLLMGGTQDGVIAQSSFRYGVEWETPTTPIERTFHEAIAGGRNDSYLLLQKPCDTWPVIPSWLLWNGNKPMAAFGTARWQIPQVRLAPRDNKRI